MSAFAAAKRILEILDSGGLHPDEYVSIDRVATQLFHQGLDIEDLKLGLVAGIELGWIQPLDHFIGMTQFGYGVMNPANDNCGLRIVQ